MNMSMIGLWHEAGMFARGVIGVLAIMSIYGLTICVQKWMKSP